MKIAIIGAGPRGILVAERSLHELPDAEVQIFDAAGIGGQTWRIDKKPVLIMNTPVEQVQQFDWTPNLYEWCKTKADSFIKNQSETSNEILNDLVGLAHNGYPTRRLYAAYLKYCYQSVPNYHKIKVNQFNVDGIEPHSEQYKLFFNDSSDIFDKVVVTIDNGDNSLSPSEKSLFDYSEKFKLNYFTPTNQLNADFINTLSSNQTVIVRGLGLNFYDLLAQFIDRWEGKFIRDINGKLKYQPAGNEQHLVIGSHRGLPHYPRPINQDGPVSEHNPVFLSISNIINYSKKHSVTKYQAFIQLVKLEVEFHYYSALVERGNGGDLKNFQDKVIEKKAIPDIFNNDDKIDWEYLLDPITSVNSADYRKNMLSWLEFVTNNARLGSKGEGIFAVLNVIRGLYNTILDIYTNHDISDDEFKFNFSTKFNNEFVFLISGAPCFRTEQLLALIKANVIDLLAPGMQIDCQDSLFLTYSKLTPDEVFKSNYLIEARQPSVNLAYSKNPLIKSLIANNLLSTFRVNVGDQYASLRGSRINSNYQLVNEEGHAMPNLYMFSQINVGERWLTNVCPRSGDDYSRRIARKIISEFSSHIR